MCLSREGWAQNDRIQEEDSSCGPTEAHVTEVEPENQTLNEPVTTSGDVNRGSYDKFERNLKVQI